MVQIKIAMWLQELLYMQGMYWTVSIYALVKKMVPFKNFLQIMSYVQRLFVVCCGMVSSMHALGN